MPRSFLFVHLSGAGDDCCKLAIRSETRTETDAPPRGAPLPVYTIQNHSTAGLRCPRTVFTRFYIHLLLLHPLSKSYVIVICLGCTRSQNGQRFATSPFEFDVLKRTIACCFCVISILLFAFLSASCTIDVATSQCQIGHPSLCQEVSLSQALC